MTLDNGTDGQTDRRTDRVRRNMRPPPREEGRIKITRSHKISVNLVIMEGLLKSVGYEYQSVRATVQMVECGSAAIKLQQRQY